jgi:hypothetical protein
MHGSIRIRWNVPAQRAVEWRKRELATSRTGFASIRVATPAATAVSIAGNTAMAMVRSQSSYRASTPAPTRRPGNICAASRNQSSRSTASQ